ncbi:MAG: UDP-N-acetylmuramate--L-alanine ligase [Pseudomonadota bacterium]
MFNKYQKIHFVGIGGIGMSGIAEILLTRGLTVTGSDLKLSSVTKKLKRRGATIWEGHHKKHVFGAHVVVVSSAVSKTNPEVKQALKMGVPVVPRAEMLAELMRLNYGIAVAGTHGKTTTTSLIASVLEKAGFDPTVVIGGKVKSLRGNARTGKGNFLVAEADESDRSFLKLSPTIGVITNIDPEHLENYRSFNHLKEAFANFANKVPFYGSTICCSDHPVVRRILPKVDRRLITYGVNGGSDYTAKNILVQNDRLNFEVYYQQESLGKITLPMVGRHQVMNALAAIAVGRELDIPFASIKKSLKCFSGISRRFEVLSRKGPLVVDDYAHHPVEIAATIVAAKESWPEKRLIAVVQPHRFSRLKALFEEFVQVLKPADMILVMDVYAASEKPLRGISGKNLCEAIRKKYLKKPVAYAPNKAEVFTNLNSWCGQDDLVLFLGAGDITKVAHEYAKTLK